jgi:hypothetical protein
VIADASTFETTDMNDAIVMQSFANIAQFQEFSSVKACRAPSRVAQPPGCGFSPSGFNPGYNPDFQTRPGCNPWGKGAFSSQPVIFRLGVAAVWPSQISFNDADE